MPDSKPSSRRRHDDELKRIVLLECRQPGASVARIAMAHGLNANLVHKWRRHAQPKEGAVVAAPAQSFLPLAVAPAAVRNEVHIELRRGALAVRVDWPLSAMAECAAWLRELLR